MAYFRCIGGGNGSSQGFVVGNVTRIIEGKWDGTGSTTYTFDKDINDCLLFLTYTRETHLTDTRYTLTLASGTYDVLEDTKEVIGSTTRTRTVCLHVKEIKANDTLYMYNYGDQRNADLCEIVETPNILNGTSTPSSSQGSNGQIYL